MIRKTLESGPDSDIRNREGVADDACTSGNIRVELLEFLLGILSTDDPSYAVRTW